MQRGLVHLLLYSLLFAQENIDGLLKRYEQEAELSKITKIDTAGCLYIYTRQMLEAMQAYTLADVLKSVPGLLYTITSNNLHLFSAPSSSFIPATAARLYINDHDVTSASFGSALLIWGDMPIEYIDHIEVYKGTSAIEFGEETAIIIIKVYTKLAKREMGKKLRLRIDSLGSKSIDTYVAKSNQSSLFLYWHGADTKSKHYLKQNSVISRDRNDFTFYTRYSANNFSLEASHYLLNKDPFLGYGRSQRALGGGLDAKHSYINFNTNFLGGHWNIAYDRLNYNRVYKDAKGVYISKGLIQRFRLHFRDEIFTIAFKRHLKGGKHSLLLGGFYKYKYFAQKGRFDTIHTNFSNSFHLFTLYAEESYCIDKGFLAIFSLKGDLYHYEKSVKDQSLAIVRLGVIKNIDGWQWKGFYTKTYLPVQFFALYSKDNTPFITDPNLKYPTLNIFTLEAIKRDTNYIITYKFGRRNIKNLINYFPKTGYHNIKKRLYYTIAEVNFAYLLNANNKIYIDLVKGINSQGTYSPDIQINVRLFNTYKMFTIYNELLYKNSYSYYGKYIKDSLDYTMAIKYQISRDLSIGMRGENLLTKGFRQAYRIAEAYPINDRRYIFNMEYTF